MIGSFTEKLRARFADKFSANGDGYVYRRTRDSKPIIISAKDHIFLIDDFDRRLTAFTSVSIGVILISIIAAIGIALGDFPPGLRFVAIAGIFPAALWFDLWDTPEIAFYQRLVDKGEHRKIPFLLRDAISRSWSSIIWVALFCVFLADQHSPDPAPEWWNKIILVALAVGVAYLMLIAVIKALSYGGSRHKHLYQRN